MEHYTFILVSLLINVSLILIYLKKIDFINVIVHELGYISYSYVKIPWVYHLI